MVPSGIAFELPTVLKHPSAHISLSFYPFLSHFSIHLFSKGELVQIIRREPSPPVFFSRLVLYFGTSKRFCLNPACLHSLSVFLLPCLCDGLAKLHGFILVFLCAKCDPPKCWGSRRGKFSLTSYPGKTKTLQFRNGHQRPNVQSEWAA